MRIPALHQRGNMQRTVRSRRFSMLMSSRIWRKVLSIRYLRIINFWEALQLIQLMVNGRCSEFLGRGVGATIQGFDLVGNQIVTKHIRRFALYSLDISWFDIQLRLLIFKKRN